MSIDAWGDPHTWPKIVVSEAEFDRLIEWLDEDDDPAEISELREALTRPRRFRQVDQ